MISWLSKEEHKADALALGAEAYQVQAYCEVMRKMPDAACTDGYATQKFSVGYAVQNFNATVSTKQYGTERLVRRL